jgi:hypothetical protein
MASVTGFLQAEPECAKSTPVLNGFAQLILDLFGQEVGQHARTAIGVATLALNSPVVVHPAICR